MLHFPIAKISLILYVCCLSMIALGQEFDWKYISNIESQGTGAFQLDNGNYLFSEKEGSKLLNRLVSEDGEILLTNELCNCAGIVFYHRLNADSILSITQVGVVLITDYSGGLLDSLYQLSFNTRLMPQNFAVNDSIVIILGHSPSEGAPTHHTINLSTLALGSEHLGEASGIASAVTFLGDSYVLELYNDGNNYLLVKKALDGSVVWQSTGEQLRGAMRDLFVTEDHQVFIAGDIASTHSEANWRILIRIDSTGDETWRRIYEHSTASHPTSRYFFRIRQGPNGSITLGGHERFTSRGPNSQLFFTNVDREGNINWEVGAYVMIGHEYVADMLYNQSGKIIAVGGTGLQDTDPDYFVGYIVSVDVITTSVSNPDEPELFVWPNPAHNTLNVDKSIENRDYIITNVMGQIVRAGITSQQISLGNLEPGMYILKIEGFRSTHIVKL